MTDKLASRGPFGHDGPLDYYDEIVAVYDPPIRADLSPGAGQCIGSIARWRAGWIIGESDSKRYCGQWAMIVDRDSAVRGWPFAWAPECDLRRVNEG